MQSVPNTGIPNVFGMSLAQLEAHFTSRGEKAFRARQAYQWLYKHDVDSFAEMTDFSRELRADLESTLRLLKPRYCSVQLSGETEASKTRKLLFELEDGQKIETVYIPDGDRKTVCLSTQAGCAVGCIFCATGWMGFKRNLSPGEIVGQLSYIRKHVDAGISNIVFMGMGEPFLNYDAVIEAAKIIASESGVGLAGKHITISTSGIIPRIYQYADEGHPYNLAISLNATTEGVRGRIMPITKKYGLDELMEAARYFVRSRKRSNLTLEYVLLAGVNDTDEDARRIRSMVASLGRCKVNVIPYNPIKGPELSRPSDEHVEKFLRSVSSIQSPLTLRRSRGQDISAACGQLAVQS